MRSSLFNSLVGLVIGGFLGAAIAFGAFAVFDKDNLNVSIAMPSEQDEFGFQVSSTTPCEKWQQASAFLDAPTGIVGIILQEGDTNSIAKRAASLQMLLDECLVSQR